MFVFAVVDKIWSFLLSGGIFMGFIGVASFVALAVAIHVGLSLRKKVVVPAELTKEVERAERHFKSDNAAVLRQHLKQSGTPLGKIGAIAIDDRFADREEATQAVEANAREEVVKLQNGMGILEVVITIAPLLGLLGTVSGLVNVFSTLGSSAENAADPSRLAAGIAIALNTTIAGLVVAILTVIVHSIFTRRIEGLSARLEVLAADLIQAFYRCGGASLYSSGPLLAENVPSSEGEEESTEDFLS